MSRKLLSVVLALAWAFVLSACGSGGSSSVQEYTLTYEAGEGGSIAGPAEQVVAAGEDGEPVTAEPDTGHHFVQWDDGVDTAERTESDVQEAVHVTAEFALNEYTLEYAAGPGGSIDGPTPQTVDHGEDGETVTATADAGFHFVQWSDGVEAAERTDTDLQGDLAVTAEFAINQYSVSYSAGEGGSIMGPTPQTVEHGDDAETVTAVPTTGYHFVQWSDGLGTPERTDMAIQGDISATAEFALNEYTLTYTAGEGGSIDGDTPQNVSHGSDGSVVTAVADIGYTFVQWSDGVTTAARTDTDVQGDLAVSAEFELNHYSLSYLAETGGSISGPASQTVAHGSDGETVTAVPETGYSFTQWSDGVTTAERTDTNVQADLEATAEFDLNQYTLSYEAGEGGSISGPAEQTVDHGDDATAVTAEPDEGYSFVQWSDGLETAERTDTSIDGDLSVTAEFELNQYTLSYSADTGGEISGETEQTVDHGADGSAVTAEPDTGYHFVQWSDGVTTAERTDTDVQGDLSVTAQFELNEYALSYTAGEGGSITGEAEQTVDHGADGNTVTAEPDTGYHFVQWSDGVTTVERTDTNLQGDLSVTAEFALNEYTLNYSAGAGGSITGESEQTVSHGSNGSTVTAVADTGYTFVQWNDGVTTAERTDTDVQGDLSVVAEFELNEYSLSYTAGTGGGLTGETEQVVDHGSDGTTVTAVPDTGYTFIQWSDGVTTAERMDTGVDSDLSVTAEFSLNEYTLIYTAGEGGSITGEVEQTVNHGDDGSAVTAEPETGYSFEGWSDGVETPERTDTNVQGDLSVTAEFSLNEYSVTYSAGPGGSVSGPVDQTVSHGSDAESVAAEPDTGYHFVQWSDGVTTAERMDTELQADLSVTAVFELNEYTLNYSAGTGGSITGATEQTVNHGSDGSTVAAEADTGYTFVQWSDGVTTAERTDTDVQGDLSVTAEFELNQYSLTYTSDTVGSIDGPASQTVSHGDDGETVTAVAETEGYVFVQWSDGVTTPERTDTNIQADLSVHAEFTLDEYSLTYTAGEGGSITGETEQTVLHGSDASTVTAVPDTGYSFVQWSDGVTTAERTDTGVDGDLSVTAEFELNEYVLSYSAGTGGSITGETEQTVSHGSDGSTVTAVADTGYTFVQWTDGVTTAERTDTDIQGDLSVTAEFELIQYNLSYIAGEGGSITGEAEQTVNHGEDGGTVTAVADAGYTFSQWSDGVTTAERTDTGVDGDLSVTAEFELNEYTLEYTAGEGGSISGPASQTVAHGEDGTSVTAEPDAGYVFDRWNDGVTTAERTDSDVQGDLSVEAEFLQLLSVGGTVSGLDGDGLVLENNQSDELPVSADGGFTFEKTLPEGDSYDVIISQQPESQWCSVDNASGVLEGGDVTDVLVTCEAFSLDAVSGFGQITLSWSPAVAADVIWSSDPDCDWDNYASCDDSGLLAGQDSDISLDRHDGLRPGRDYFFVVQSSGARTGAAGGSPWIPGVNNTVNASVVYEGGWYIGGDFVRTLTDTGPTLVLGQTDGQPRSVMQDVVGTVLAVAPDSEGGWYIGGNFTEVAGEPRENLAHIRADGSVDPDWNPGANDDVRALAVVDGVVYAGGVFSEAGGQTRNRFAAFDASTGALDDFNPGFNAFFGPAVNALVIDAGTLYVGGQFINTAGESRDRLAAFDLASGELKDLNPEIVGTVHALAVANGVLYVGGDFEEIDGEARGRLAAFDLASDALMAWAPEANDIVYALATSDETLYAGGEFSSIDDEGRTHLVAFATATGGLRAWAPVLNDTVQALAVNGERLFVGGDFTSVDDQARFRLAAFETDDGTPVEWVRGVNATVHALASESGRVYAGGEFDLFYGERRERLAAFDAYTGALLDWAPEVNNTVHTLLGHDGLIYAGGAFTPEDDFNRARIAAFDADSGEVTGWNPFANGVVRALATDGSRIYMGGDFTGGFGWSRERLAAFNPGTNQPLAWEPGANARVRALVVTNGVVYAGGNFTEAGGDSRAHLAAFDADDGALEDWNPGFPDLVWTLAADGTAVYAGGGPWGQGYLQAVDTSPEADLQWELEFEDRLHALALNDGVLYAGGRFRSADEEDRFRLAAVDAQSGLLADWTPVANDTVLSLVAQGETVWAAGAFRAIDGERRRRLAMIDADVGALVEQTYELSYNAGAGGSILGTSLQKVVEGDDGDSVIAQSDTGHTFVQWSDGLDTPERIETGVTSNLSVTAEFVASDEYTLTYAAGPGGSLSGPTPQTVTHGEDGETITAVPDTGYHFVQWSDGLASAGRTDTAVQADITTTAEFSINQYTLSYSAGPGGSVSGPTPQTVDHGDDGATVTAVPDTGHSFVQWSDGVETPERTDTGIEDDLSVAAEFEPDEYTLTYSAGSNGSLDGDTSQTVTHGSDGTTVTAIPDEGYVFDQWSDGFSEAERTDTNVQGDITVEAGFIPPFSIGGTVTGLEGDGLQLALNGGEQTLNVPAGASDFVFDDTVMDGHSYDVTVNAQPESVEQTCTVDNGSGTVTGADVADIEVHCTTLEVSLVARTDIMQMHLEWDGPSTVDILYSSDPDCDWLNYASCDDSGMLPGQSGGELTLGAVEDDFDPDTGWYFVARNGSEFSDQDGARPVPPGFDDDVLSTVVGGDELYVGGFFRRLIVETGGGVMLPADRQGFVGTMPTIVGEVRAVASDGQGGWYIGSEFTQTNGEVISNLARVRRDGSIDPGWTPTIDEPVRALAVHNGVVYAGGEFTEANGVARAGLAAFDADSGALDPDWNPGADGRVYALAVSADTVYAGGAFNNAGGVERNHLAAFDAAGVGDGSGTVDPIWNPAPTNTVFALIAEADRVYAGGSFHSIGGESRTRLAALEASGEGDGTGVAIPGWNPEISGGAVLVLAMEFGVLYAGGLFTSVDGDGRMRVAAFDAASGALDPDWAPQVDGRVDALAVGMDKVFVGGDFTIPGDVQRSHLAVFDSAWFGDGTGALIEDTAPGASGPVLALDVFDNRLYVGGEFSNAGGIQRERLVAFNAQSGVLRAAWTPSVVGGVHALLVEGDRLYVGGYFSIANGEPRQHLAAFGTAHTESSTGVLHPWAPEVSGPEVHGGVRALAYSADTVYAAGGFTSANGVERNRLAAFDTDTGGLYMAWDPEWEERDPESDFEWNMVFDLDISGNRLYAGGGYRLIIDGAWVRGGRVTALPLRGEGDGSAHWIAEPDRWVEALVADEDTVYAGGRFEIAQGEDRTGVAAFDATTGVIDAGWDPELAHTVSTMPTIRSLALSSGRVYVGGRYRPLDSLQQFNLVAFTLAQTGFSSGSAISDWDPGLIQSDGGPYSLTLHDDRIFAGGSSINFSTSFGRPGLAVFDTDTGELLW